MERVAIQRHICEWDLADAVLSLASIKEITAVLLRERVVDMERLDEEIGGFFVNILIFFEGRLGDLF